MRRLRGKLNCENELPVDWFFPVFLSNFCEWIFQLCCRQKIVEEYFEWLKGHRKNENGVPKQGTVSFCRDLSITLVIITLRINSLYIYFHRASNKRSLLLSWICLSFAKNSESALSVCGATRDPKDVERYASVRQLRKELSVYSFSEWRCFDKF